MIALALLLLQTTQPPVLAFPEPGVDDTAAYQGYRTRFHRDAAGNTVQIYLEPRAGRVVNLWADAADESLGFTVRDPAGRPAPLDWGAAGAQVADSGDVRTLSWSLAIGAPRAEIGGFLLGTMRVERDYQYAKAQLRPFTAPPYRVAEESLLVASLSRLPRDEQARHLALLHARDPAELRGRLLPTIGAACAAACVARIEHTSLTGRTHLRLELEADTGAARMEIRGRAVTFRSRSGGPIRLTVRIATDAGALTPIAREAMFTQSFLDFLARRRSDSTSLAGRLAGRRLEREVRSVELLGSEEKLMAGLPNFATYFGRDMLMAALMMRPVWQPAMSEHVIASVLRKLGPRGDVSHEEALGEQAIREGAAEYHALIAAYFAAGRNAAQACDTIMTDAALSAGDIGTAGRLQPGVSPAPDAGAPAVPARRATAGCLERARTVLRGLERTRENYHMLDDELQLPVLEARYLTDPAVTADRKRSFLLARDTAGVSRLALMLRELALVARETRPYADDPRPGNLIGFVKRDATHWRSASWRDSDAGYANGRYAMDINAIWAPRALDALATILATLPGLGLGRPALDSLAAPLAAGAIGITDGMLAGYLADTTALRRAVETWRGARRHFLVTLPPAEIGRRVADRLTRLPPAERTFWRHVVDSAAIRDSLAFLALSLDSAATPIPVLNTDPATELFLDATGGAPVPLDQLPAMLRPYPVGLLVARLGPLVANDAYANRRVWDTFAADPYHGPRVVWGREVNLMLLGLTAAAGRAGVPESVVTTAREASRRILDAVRASGLEHSELWSYRIEGGRLQPTRYGTGSDAQLWSSTDLAVQYLMSRTPER
jgi:hypothetical protein